MKIDYRKHIDKNHVIADIVRALKDARQKKGLSQRELSVRIGVPQSHISKIENAAVDLKLSSLIELARALELELLLVPRPFVPVVEGLQRASGSQGAEQYSRLEIEVMDELETLAKTVARLIRRFESGNVQDDDELVKLERILRAIAPLRVSRAQARELRDIARDLRQPLKTLNALRELHAEVGYAANYQQTIRDKFTIIRPLRQSLEAMRNAIVHGANDQGWAPIPAYRLDEEDENA